MSLKKPIGLKSVPIVVLVTFVAIYFAAKLGLGSEADKSGINDAMAFFTAISFSFIAGLVVGLMVVFGRKR